MGHLGGLFDVLAVQGGVTMLGYVCAATGVVTEGRSLSQFVSCVALPCLLLKSMATVDLSQVNLNFVASMAATKLVVMFAGWIFGAGLFTGGRFKSAAIGGLLATCSNDLAFGLPLVRALHPDLGFYVVILATLQNALCNPACFVLMEIGVAREESGSASCASVVRVAAKRIACNFVVLAVLVGICLNIALEAHLPEAVAALLGAPRTARLALLMSSMRAFSAICLPLCISYALLVW